MILGFGVCSPVNQAISLLVHPLVFVTASFFDSAVACMHSFTLMAARVDEMT